MMLLWAWVRQSVNEDVSDERAVVDDGWRIGVWGTTACACFPESGQKVFVSGVAEGANVCRVGSW